jgi:HAD superfamily phosphatase
MNKPILAFDMDGVLVDVSESFRETIQQTVRHFTGQAITREEIQDYKNRGGYNDDWKISHHAILKAGVDVKYEDVVDYFQEIFHGTNGQPGLILREKWIAEPGRLESLAERYQLAVFTGRMRWEADVTLNRCSTVTFDPIVGLHDVENPKPAPDGLLKIREMFPDRRLWYIGDTVDDARCARAAKVPFIGITSPANPRYLDVVDLFFAEKAYAIIDDINFLEEVLES